ncbi:insulin-like peptide INSL5 [Nycticebus coucang]|uniref:insulin-like peptide INSL5 n=1 Tax=Nycticebus coucang TaxID=9470 RepID=UPI00234DC3B1|nr:insulin-like peptide INSL5 [Nycticebus coucang]
MRGPVITLFLFSVLFAISEVKSKDLVRLCGPEYRRLFIYICASSRWRRHVEGSPRVQPAERGNSFQLPDTQEVSEEKTARNLPRVPASGEDQPHGGQTAMAGLWEARKRSAMSRQDLQALCCTRGCSLAELSALC